MYHNKQKTLNYVIFSVDTISVIISYILATYLWVVLYRGQLQYSRDTIFDNMGMFLFSFMLTILFFNVNKEFFKRGMLTEFMHCVKMNLLFAAVVSILIVVEGTFGTISRGVIMCTVILNTMIMCVGHIVLREYLINVYVNKNKNIQMFLVTTVDRANSVVKKMNKHSEWYNKVQGIAFIDDDMKGQEINYYFLGALYLFVINCIFIVLATYIMVKYLNFSGIEFQDNKKEKRTKTLITAIVILFIVPSILSAMSMIRENKFKIEVEAFIAENKNLEKGYIYDYRINTRKGRSVEVFIAGDPMTASEKSRLMESAERHGISEGQIRFSERKLSDNEGDASETLMKGIYARTDQEISKREKRIADLENELSAYRSEEIPYARIVREIKSQYPSVTGIFIGKGAAVQADSLSLRHGIAVIADYDGKISEEECRKLEEWLRIRLEDDSLTVVHRFHENPGKTR